MKTKEEFIEGKMKAIAEQAKHIKRCVYMIKRISKYPQPKHTGTYWRRSMRAFNYAASIRTCLMQIEIIMAQTQSESLPVVGNLFANAD